MLGENKKTINLLYIISMVLIGVGAVAGAVYYALRFNSAESVRSHLTQYFESVKVGMDFNGIVKSSVKDYAIICGAVAVMSFTKLGPLCGGFLLLRTGFVNAFTVASFVDFYGLNGVILAIELIPKIILIIPTMCFYTAVSAVFSQKRGELAKKEKIFYIIFSCFVYAIFCISALAEGGITTTFMKWVVFKVT